MLKRMNDSQGFRASFLIGCFLILICIVWFATGCEGEQGAQGITGAQGAKGEQGGTGEDGQDGQDGEDGESGIPPIIPITGMFVMGHYSESSDYASFYDTRIDEGDIVQLYLSSNPDVYAWLFYPDYQVTDYKMYIQGEDYWLVGKYYLILVIKG